MTVTIPTSPPTAPTSVSGSITSLTSASLKWSPPAIAGSAAITGYRVSRDGGTTGATSWSTTVPATLRSQTFTNLVAGRTYTLSVAAINSLGTGPATQVTVIPGTPGAPSNVAGRAATAGTSQVLTWSPPTAIAGASAIAGYRVSHATTAQPKPHLDSRRPRIRPLLHVHQTRRRVLLQANRYGYQRPRRRRTLHHPDPRSTPASAPPIGTAAPGTAGGAITAFVNWGYPTAWNGANVTTYIVRALRMSSNGTVLGTTTATITDWNTDPYEMTLPQTGNYRFTVQAPSNVGSSPQSTRSNLVAGR